MMSGADSNSNTRPILGIDPGITGGIAALYPDGRIEAYDIPTGFPRSQPLEVPALWPCHLLTLRISALYEEPKACDSVKGDWP